MKFLPHSDFYEQSILLWRQLKSFYRMMKTIKVIKDNRENLIHHPDLSGWRYLNLYNYRFIPMYRAYGERILETTPEFIRGGMANHKINNRFTP
ncbi:MAG TPA: hypothetical protein DHW42_04785, partial [Candidatus Marinimicrobia bacterium]|nr:hypothetical protein [Candidatus Neomarinimicrobiota bacterium]